MQMMNICNLSREIALTFWKKIVDDHVPATPNWVKGMEDYRDEVIAEHTKVKEDLLEVLEELIQEARGEIRKTGGDRSMSHTFSCPSIRSLD